MPVIPNQRQHGQSAFTPHIGLKRAALIAPSRALSPLPAVLGHLTVMKSENLPDTPATAPSLSLANGVLSLSELCTQLQVSAQTIYDLRSQGRGPRGFVSADSCVSASARSKPD
jgi:hypothetical protein